MNSNSNNNNVGGGGGGVIKSLNRKLPQQESTNPYIRRQKKLQEEDAQHKLEAEIIQEKRENIQIKIALYKRKEEVRLQEKEKKIQEKETLETVKSYLQQRAPNCDILMIENEILKSYQNREKTYIYIYKYHLLIGTYTIDDKNNKTFLDNEGHHCTPSGFALKHKNNINKILNCSLDNPTVDGWDRCLIVNEKGEWVKLNTIKPPKSDDDA